jgi:hypothetical protein
MLMPAIAKLQCQDDVIVFSDCDEIPRAETVAARDTSAGRGSASLKQRSFYYTVNRLADYGNDFASRARMGTWAQVEDCGTMYAFRMYQKNLPGAGERRLALRVLRHGHQSHQEQGRLTVTVPLRVQTLRRPAARARHCQR